MAPVDPSPNQEEDSAVFRSLLRKERIAARMGLSDAFHAQASVSIERRLDALLAARKPQVIAFCWPLRREFDCRPLVKRLIAAGWQGAQPVVVEPEAPMVFRPWVPSMPMTQDRHGIPIPDNEDCIVPDVVLLPLVAFDAQAYRLGYGGGYFDRSLSAMSPKPYAIGVGFEVGRVDSIRPAPHDVRLDAIVTEAVSLLVS